MFRLLVLTGCLASAMFGQTLSIEEYEPRSTLVAPAHAVARAKYPLVDVHAHPRPRSPADMPKLLGEMDSINLRAMVILFGGSGERLKKNLELYRSGDPNRFVLFATIDWNGIDDPDWGPRTAAQLEGDVRAGAVGLKIWRNFGMEVKYRDGRRVPVDDPKLNPIFEACARLKIPVSIHCADPWTHFQPIDKYNERWLELKQFPGRRYPPERYAAWETLMAERDRLLARHPKVTFILNHMGWMAHNLKALGELFDRLPNVNGECGAIMHELGRQPFTARDFYIKHQDRVLFGKDSYMVPEYPYYFRLFETRDEYFSHSRKYQALWQLYGLDLPDEVLKKLYYKNAARIIPALNAAQFPK